MKPQNVGLKIQAMVSFINVETLKPITVTDRLNYMRAEMYLDGWIDAAEEDPMRSNQMVEKFRNVLTIIRERKVLHEQLGKKV